MTPAPDSTAVRVALWRALHVLQDPAPHVFDDTLGLRLADPDPAWQARPDMSPFTRAFRASIVARARFVEDLLEKEADVGQYVLLGAGLDTFAQRCPSDRLQIFEVDRPGASAWKRDRLTAIGLPPGSNLHFVPVDFESEEDWWTRLTTEGFDPGAPAVVTALGVIMYLGTDAIGDMLHRLARLAPGSTVIVSFLLPIQRAAPEVRPGLERAAQGAAASGTPFLSYFEPAEIIARVRAAGFTDVEHISAAELGARYFAGRADGLCPPENTEELVVARI